MGTKAANEALVMAGVKPDSIDLIVVSTCTPNFIFPSTACLIQAEWG